MDFEKRARRQSYRVIVSEILMVVTVAVTVLILAFVVSGYWLNSNFEVERQGLLQISSMPTGADVKIDGEGAWLQRTNTSKVLPSGEHTVTLSKDEYDSWSKTVNIKEGLLYRIGYPRLFLKEREKKPVYNSATATLATVSPDRNSMLLANNTTSWTLLSLDNENLSPTRIDVSGVFSTDSSSTNLFKGQILTANWSRDDEHILISSKKDSKVEWVILNVKNVSSSINLTRDFAANFENIKIIDNSANTLLAVVAGNLHKIDVSSRQISATLAKDVYDFDFHDGLVVFSAKSEDAKKDTEDEKAEDGKKPYYIGLLKLGDDKITELKTTDLAAKLLISRFYDEKYITTIKNDLITMYSKEKFEEVLSNTLSFTPQKIRASYGGDFIVASDGNRIATIDMEAMEVIEWSVPAADFGWLDNSMIYAVYDGELSVYDFDGLNHRALSNNVSSHFPVTITNDKWMYYFSDGNLIREVIAK